MRKIAYIGLGVFLLVSFAAAQIPTSGNIFVGYSLENTNWAGLNSNLSRPNLNGWEASLEGKLFPHVGIVTDFASHYGSQSFTEAPPPVPGSARVNVTGHEWEALFGPRLSIPVGNFTPFAEAMIGVAHVHNGGDFPSSANTSFATAIGGGLDYRLIKGLAVRLEANYLQTRFYSTTQDNLRLSTGVVVRF
ncbi:MAG TPA: outer membrane beta-barrel protein [Candidatus Sulfotelmatobacter sp.]|nr:outer membrane beta-barrel protein [Candidatus Sulfotelmatobacter sp.]